MDASRVGFKPLQQNQTRKPANENSGKVKEALPQAVSDQFQPSENAGVEDIAKGDKAHSKGVKSLLTAAGFVALGIAGIATGGTLGIGMAVAGGVGSYLKGREAAENLKESNSLYEKAIGDLTPPENSKGNSASAPLAVLQESPPPSS
jgi:hypothetical protein